MSMLAESLRRLYKDKGFITEAYLKYLLDKNTITQDEFDYIIA